jgi:hypothetical protein
MNSSALAKSRFLLVTPAFWTVIVFLSAAPVSSRGSDLQELLSGKRHPLIVKLGELGKEWRRFTIHIAGNASGNVSVSVTGSGGTSGSSQNNIADLSGSRIYLTKGQTVSALGQVYLVAYRMPGSGLDFPALIQALATKAPPQVTTLTPETELPLSLLDVPNLGSLDDIRAFDLKREIAESEKLTQTIGSALKAASGGETTKAAQPGSDKSGK